LLILHFKNYAKLYIEGKDLKDDIDDDPNSKKERKKIFKKFAIV
jgi:hypothetical protein